MNERSYKDVIISVLITRPGKATLDKLIAPPAAIGFDCFLSPMWVSLTHPLSLRRRQRTLRQIFPKKQLLSFCRFVNVLSAIRTLLHQPVYWLTNLSVYRCTHYIRRILTLSFRRKNFVTRVQECGIDRQICFCTFNVNLR